MFLVKSYNKTSFEAKVRFNFAKNDDFVKLKIKFLKIFFKTIKYTLILIKKLRAIKQKISILLIYLFYLKIASKK